VLILRQFQPVKPSPNKQLGEFRTSRRAASTYFLIPPLHSQPGNRSSFHLRSFMNENKPPFDLVTICPPYVFGVSSSPLLTSIIFSGELTRFFFPLPPASPSCKRSAPSIRSTLASVPSSKPYRVPLAEAPRRDRLLTQQGTGST